MAVSEDYKKFIEDQLSGISNIEVKRMFGGVGFFNEGLMFGMLGGEVFRLKVDKHNEEAFRNAGMTPYYSSKKKKGMPYWEVPQSVIEDRDELALWAQKSIEAAQRAKK